LLNKERREMSYLEKYKEIKRGKLYCAYGVLFLLGMIVGWLVGR